MQDSFWLTLRIESEAHQSQHALNHLGLAEAVILSYPWAKARTICRRHYPSAVVKFLAKPFATLFISHSHSVQDMVRMSL